MARCLVTGGAGFIGSALVRALLKNGHEITVVDNLSTGHMRNLAAVADSVHFFNTDICDAEHLASLFSRMEICFHLAALPSVPRSISDPFSSNRVNVDGTLAVFLAAHAAGVRRVIFASSSSVYGLSPIFPLTETLTRSPISPYAVTKVTGEMYAEVFSRLYDMDFVGLRYFNVFGPRQDPNSPYSAVIPRFISRMSRGQSPIVFGDGTQARDFTYVDNVVNANILAAEKSGRLSGCYNIGCGVSTSLLDLVSMLNNILSSRLIPEFQPPRPGDIQNSCADIAAARAAFSYSPLISVPEGLQRTAAWLQSEDLTRT